MRPVLTTVTFSHLKTVMKDLFVKEEVVSGYIQALSHLISFQR